MLKTEVFSLFVLLILVLSSDPLFFLFALELSRPLFRNLFSSSLFLFHPSSSLPSFISPIERSRLILHLLSQFHRMFDYEERGRAFFVDLMVGLSFLCGKSTPEEKLMFAFALLDADGEQTLITVMHSRATCF